MILELSQRLNVPTPTEHNVITISSQEAESETDHDKRPAQKSPFHPRRPRPPSQASCGHR